MPAEHIDFSIENGADALAITDHGNCNAYSYQYLHTKKLKDKGVNFKSISGVEAYYIPSLKDWRKLKNEQDGNKADEKEAKRVSKLSPEAIGDELAATKAELHELASAVVKVDEDEMGGTVIENDEETRSAKFRNPINRRNHLVLLAKNSDGLKALFRMVSASYIDGFYRYPRIDMDILRKEAKGNIVASTACISGPLMYIIAGHQTETDFNLWTPNDNNIELIQAELKTVIEEFKDALGEENFYAEIQMNALGAQHLANYHIIEAAKRTNTKLIVTCDSHYSRPEHWKARELYKAMAWASKTKGSVDATKLPERIEDLKCELYPKNAEQLWASYKKYAEPYDFYDDSIVKEAIERTWDIAHNQIDEVSFNRSVKLPVIERLVSKSNLEAAIEKLGSSEDEDAIAFEELKRLAREGLKNRNHDEDEEYITRMVHELSVVKKLKFSKYFLTYHKIMELVTKTQLSGPGRGSAAGSLLSYCLGITQVDPIKYGLLFSRFLTQFKTGMPDIDCLHADTLVIMADLSRKKIQDLVMGDMVMDHLGKPRTVLGVYTRVSNVDDEIYNVFIRQGNIIGSFIATANHRLLLDDEQEVKVVDLKIGSRIHNLDIKSKELIVIDKKLINDANIKLVDITVAVSSTFQFIPFNCCEFHTNTGNYIIGINSYSMDTDDYDNNFKGWYYDDQNEQDSRITRI